MNDPSAVSSSDIPAANRIGSDRMAQNGSPAATDPPAITSSAISVAVSKPSPKRNPTGYIFQGVSTRRASGPKNRFIMPRAFSWRSSSSWSNRPRRSPKKMPTIDTRITRLRAAIR